LVFSFLLSLGVLSIDQFVLGVSPLAEGPPIFDNIYLLRTALITLSSGLFVYAVIQLRQPKTSTVTQESEFKVWGIQGHMAVWFIQLCALTFLFIFLASPELFYQLGAEDNPIEILSATLCFLDFGIFVYISYLIYLYINHSKIHYLLISLGFAAAFFLIGMEEISWFQRALSIETPEIFKGNIQNEMNLHNFATNKVENAYYLSAFIVLILFPFVYDKLFIHKQKDLFSFFTPSRFILFSSAIFVAYNYDMWNSLFTQLSFFMTLLILMHYAYSYVRIDFNIIVVLSVIAVFVLTQAVFIVFGGDFIRAWDVTEYKELFIPLAYLLYSIEVLQRAKHLNTRTK